MLKKLALLVIVLGIIAAAVMWVLTAPQRLAVDDLPDHTPDVENGAYIFSAGGCASCHAAPERGADPTVLSGGLALASPYGTFYAPNISPDPASGIGGWSTVDFANAMLRGVSPGGSHYYPSFPYTSYQEMRPEDVIDLKAYLDTLPAVASDVPEHDLPFPFSIRRAVGVWKLLYLDGEPFRAVSGDDELNRGAYLVRALGHCGECHSPRDRIGGIIEERALSGAPSPDGEGTIPNITPHPTGIGSWSEQDIALALKDGFTPDFDTFGGSMAEVQRNLAELTDADLEAIAAYLKSVPAIESAED